MAKPLPNGIFPPECLRAGRKRIFGGVMGTFLCLLCLLLPNSGSAQNVPNADLLQMKGEFLKRVNEDKAAMGRDQDLLSRAQAAHQQALSDHDSDGAGVTQQAIENAQQALDAARQNLGDDEKRLDAANHALVLWTTIGDSIGPRALATIFRGQITVDTPQGAKPFDPNLPVQPGQHIHLGPNAFLELQLGNGSEMHLKANTDFEYERDVKGVEWQIFRGEMHKITIIMGVRGANDDARYRGLTATCAVRGTDFTLSTDGKKDTVTVLEGSVEVDPGGGRTKVTLTGGQQLVVPKTGAVASMTSLDPKAVARWWKTKQ
ncbi:MAG TPA: FecR domain-containing protein [Terracidiphilus sp.]|nr:FecR domain-containing protein [Terracidiphilus sp.]